jgi:glycine oxidase
MKVDCLIIGQGIAGSILAWQLHKRGYSLAIIDEGAEHTSSKIAAGMFNPINTKRFTVTENAVNRFDEALALYAELEAYLGLHFVHKTDIYHVFGSVKESNDYSTKMDHPFFKQYTNPTPTQEPAIINLFGAFETYLSGWINLPLMLAGVQKWLSNEHYYLTEKCDYELLKTNNGKWEYKHIEAKMVMSCEGLGIRNNPFFKDCQIIPCRGEVFTFKAPKLMLKRVVKKGIYIVPLGDDLYKCGSTYKWENDDPTLHEHDIEELVEKVRALIDVPFTIVSMGCAIRPTTRTREAFWVKHPDLQNLYAINGLGTKGVVNGPTIIRQFLSTVGL